ncbi:SDR family oxidoreductase [Phenylobacterium parvum]|uniref:Short-chain dehydrogenase n=1 Tax=Phenylobacterium parvum TaxID=2201350 RepID=A0A2Z3HWV5_9CAUL|nr:SDR family NAD(P)-dependent oxidoreductase [Phenylobacterium parvum]AWM77730.1 short-chain dehydrogenase [Phenylobacterium parvum]
MGGYIQDRVVMVTGGGGGFGRLICEKAAALGARIVCTDIDEAGLTGTAASVLAAGGRILHQRADVTALSDLRAAVTAGVREFGRIDVLVNNAGIMPLAFWRDHEAAAQAWSRCIDINIKGVMNGVMAIHDQMIAQGQGQVINISSIYGNFPVAGAGIYGATKAAVNFLSESLRVESQGRIKVTTIRPTGVPGTGLGGGVINPEAIVGILGQNTASYLGALQGRANTPLDPRQGDPGSVGYLALDPEFIADAVIHAIDQPWGVSISDITVRATGDQYIL